MWKEKDETTNIFLFLFPQEGKRIVSALFLGGQKASDDFERGSLALKGHVATE